MRRKKERSKQGQTNKHVHLTLLASFFLPSHLSFKNMYIHCHKMCVYTCISATVAAGDNQTDNHGEKASQM